MTVYTSTCCVLCVKDKPLTEEHVFPESVGGNLTARILCGECNERLGLKVDAPYAKDDAIVLARSVLGVTGKRNNVPSAFKGVFDVHTDDAELRVRLDKNFSLEVIPKVSEVRPRSDGSLEMSIIADANSRDSVGAMLRKKLERFSGTPEGKRLGLTEDQINEVTSQAVIEASRTEARRTPIDSMEVSLKTDLARHFLEHLKVAYEIACISYEGIFLHTPRAEEIRKFLWNHTLQDHSKPLELDSAARHLKAIHDTGEQLVSQIVAVLGIDEPHRYHVAVVAGQNILVSMFGWPFILCDVISQECSAFTAYINEIGQRSCYVYQSLGSQEC